MTPPLKGNDIFIDRDFALKKQFMLLRIKRNILKVDKSHRIKVQYKWNRGIYLKAEDESGFC